MSDDAKRERLWLLEGAVARSFELLQAGRPEEAQRELAGVVAPAASPGGDISEHELDAAFEAAEPDTSQMRSADQVAQEAMRASGADEPELDFSTDDGLARVAALAEGGGTELPPSFATATMAELLESQGDVEAASRIRAGLAESAASSTPPARPGRQAVLATLERWLENVRRPQA